MMVFYWGEMNFIKLKLTTFYKVYSYKLNVKWSKRFVRYTYNFLFNKDEEVMRLISEDHIDIDRKKHFILMGTTAVHH